MLVSRSENIVYLLVILGVLGGVKATHPAKNYCALLLPKTKKKEKEKEIVIFCDLIHFKDLGQK